MLDLERADTIHLRSNNCQNFDSILIIETCRLRLLAVMRLCDGFYEIYLTLHNITLHHITSHPIPSLHITSHRITLHMPALTSGIRSSISGHLPFVIASIIFRRKLIGFDHSAWFPSDRAGQVLGEEFFSPYYYCCRATSRKIRVRSATRRCRLLPPSTSPASMSDPLSANLR